MTIILNNTGNPITREERQKINENWNRIIAGLTQLQFQINVLAGGEEVDEILARIAKATADAIKATEDAEDVTARANDAIAQSEIATDNANAATMDALKAKQDADKATVDAINKITEMNTLILTTQGLNNTSQLKIDEMNTLIATSTQLNTELKTLQSQLNSEIANSKAATANANAAYEKIKGWDTAVEWKSSSTYSKNNVVTHNGSTFQSKVNNNTNNPPTATDANWILLAQRGVDGKGAVASVNGVFPDSNGNVVIDTGLLDAYTKSETDGLIASAESKFTSQGYATNDLDTATETEYKDSTISGLKHVTPNGDSFLPEQAEYLGEVVVDIDGAVTTKLYRATDLATGVVNTRVIRTDSSGVISDSTWSKGGGTGSGGKFVTVPLKLKTTAKNQKNWTIPNDQLDMSTDSVLVFFNTVYLRPEEYTITGSVGTGYKLSFDSPESEIADNNIDIVIYKNVPDVMGLISGTALVDGSVGMSKLSNEVKDAINEASQAKDAWQKGKFNDANVINLGDRSVSKSLYIDGIGGGWHGTTSVETLNITIPFDAQFSGIVKATYTTFWGNQESHGGATVIYRVANYADRGGVKQADYVIETITDSFAKTYDIRNPLFIGNELTLPIMKAPLGSMPFMIKLEVDGYLGESKPLFNAVNDATAVSVDLSSPTAGGYPWKAQTSSFLNSTGGTMTGDLVINKDSAQIKVTGTTSNGVTTSFAIKNRAASNNTNAGVEMLVQDAPALRILGDKAVQFQDSSGVWSSLQDLKTSVSSGKAKVASAITGKGVNTASDATFDQMATNINAIPTGKKSATGTVSTMGQTRFYYADNSNSELLPVVRFVIPFYADTIAIYGSDGSLMHQTIFNKSGDRFNSNTSKVSIYGGATQQAYNGNFVTLPVSVAGGYEFTLPVSNGSPVYTYKAYE